MGWQCRISMWFWSKEGRQQLKKIVIEVNGGTITIFHISG
jgi:hypothetical protein